MDIFHEHKKTHQRTKLKNTWDFTPAALSSCKVPVFRVCHCSAVNVIVTPTLLSFYLSVCPVTCMLALLSFVACASVALSATAECHAASEHHLHLVDSSPDTLSQQADLRFSGHGILALCRRSEPVARAKCLTAKAGSFSGKI